jgi:Protein of unknown function (DUF3105).
MVSGNKSKASRNARAAVVTHKTTPWGTIAAALVVVLFAVAIFGYAFLRNQENKDKIAALAPFNATAENPDPSRQIPGIVVENYQGGQHLKATDQVAYTHSPPFGGAHDVSWAACNGVVYPTAVRSENLVHSLEHGAVWIAYNPDLITGGDLDTLKEKAQNQPFTVMSPYPGLDQPISLQSWGHQLKLSDVGDVRIDQFITALRLNQYTYPEPGASCNELGPPTFSQDAPPPFVPAPAPGTPGSSPEVSPGSNVAPDGK